MSVSTLVIVSRCVLSPYPLSHSLSLLFFIFHHLLNHSELFSSIRPPLLHTLCHQLRAQTSRAWCKAGKTVPAPFAEGLHLCRFKLPLGVSPLPPVWAPGGLPGPLRRRGSRTPSLRRSPGALVSLQDLTADTHTHGFDNKKRVKDMVKEKY